MDYTLESQHSTPQVAPIDFRARLNDEQYAAVTAEPGPLLVLAGAGSGKTRTLTYRVAYLLTQGVRPDQILLLTFTNKAAREMLSRVEELTGIAATRFWGGTFHHIGHKILRRNPEQGKLGARFTILGADEAESFLREAVEEIDKTFFKDKSHPRPGPLSAMISLARNTRLPLSEAILRYFPQHEFIIDRIQPFAAAYAVRKRKHQVVDYDDLLESWLELMKTAPAIAAHYQNRFRHVLVDEYQDTNSLQAEIVDTVGAHHQVMAVGDDAQCIYSWRGANFENIISFPDRHPGTQIHRIETNYRSTPEILSLANGILAGQTRGRGFEKELRPHRSSHTKPCLVQAMDTREQALFVVSRIRGLRDEGRSLSEIAVLYRAHFQALDLQLELSRVNIPYQITSGVRFFEQAHIRDLVALLRLVYNPRDTTAFQRLAGLLPKVGAKTALKLHGIALELAREQQRDFLDALGDANVLAKVPKDAQPDWPSLTASLQQMAQAQRESSPARVVEIAIEGWYSDYLKGAYANYSQRMDDLRSLIGFAARFQDMQDLLAQIVLLNSETSDRSVDPEAEAVRLTTIHQAKGLEFDAVFILGLAEGLFPLRRAVEEGDVEEERRLFYVAATRARDELYLCFPRVNSKGGPLIALTPSRFVQELSPELYEPVRLRPRW